jgi:RNA polymerase sigma-70 factor (ECF subfamily)
VAIDRALVERLYLQADGARWRLSRDRFADALDASARQAQGSDDRDPAALARHLGALHLQDLALACACAEGDEGAWEHFVLEYRPTLYRAAGALDQSGGARDLADAIYADLFGLRERGGERQSLFRYFHGRSKLSTWLRAVLAQRHVDRLRSGRRTDALPDEDSPAALVAPEKPVEPERERYLNLIQGALARAVAALAARDRLRLACYYARDLTLAQTGRLLAEHEATTSRQLARTRKAIREDVERQLREEHRLSDAEVSRCFECVVEDAGPLDLRNMLSGDGRKESGVDRSSE